MESGSDDPLDSAFLSDDAFMVEHENSVMKSEDDDDSDDNIKKDFDNEGESDGGGGGGGMAEKQGPLREQDRFLPIANITRIMKRAIPKTGKIAKDARECVQESVSEFVSFITSEASDRCQQEKRKTINGEDVLFAMSTLGFDHYVEPLKYYLQRYREVMKGEKPSDQMEEITEFLPQRNSEPGPVEVAQHQQVVFYDYTM
ncbi:unnamed protein product [Notodromas monacha]|uniref:Transcription factor CBF/NF-Y/archaeal histone domain-containing protein n=1 Tax=Notodromas monacha TaxID=399045 RepID=A0A7R9BNM1_9CRUS|nr:unnamed protein product [Notodromas monacha]CAG0918840.1 unnamed protein product [Notodromas monacha]